ncbi:hypothetical protein AB4305_24965 [Nocardia sp. 2YAB30]|uniref:hypothetical protein n=1 Tax=Nocardia sp. 2YAB30 TaxID=3233022 RepID=UPI003F9BFCE1
MTALLGDGITHPALGEGYASLTVFRVHAPAQAAAGWSDQLCRDIFRHDARPDPTGWEWCAAAFAVTAAVEVEIVVFSHDKEQLVTAAAPCMVSLGRSRALPFRKRVR